MRWIIRTLLVASLLAPAETGRAADCAFENPGFATGARRPARLLLMHPRAEVVDGRGGSGAAVADADVLERALAGELHSRLELLGYSVDGSSLAPAALAGNAQARRLRDEAWRRYDERVSCACEPGAEATEEEMSLGDVLVPLEHEYDVDGVVFTRARTVLQSRGVKKLMRGVNVVAPEARWPGVQADITRLEVALVEIATGDVLTLSAVVVAGAIDKRPAGIIADTVDSALADWPAIGSVSAWAAAGPLPTAPHRVLSCSALMDQYIRRTSGALGTSAQQQRERTGFVRRESPDAAAMFASEPPPRAIGVLQLRRGGAPGLAVENQLDGPVHVSISLGPWLELAPGDVVLSDVEPSRPWLLVKSEDGTEIARAACDDAVTMRVEARLVAP